MRVLYSVIFLSIVAIILSFSIGAFYSYFYPLKYKDSIIKYGEIYGVEAGIIASVANVESGFNEDAKSNKGAIGIMQLLPNTAKWVAEKIDEDYSEEMLFSGEYNIKLGTYYLSYLLTQFHDSKVALCAYNAGEGNVKTWLKNKEFSSEGVSLNKIPFKETENYLNRILKNYSYYKVKYYRG